MSADGDINSQDLISSSVEKNEGNQLSDFVSFDIIQKTSNFIRSLISNELEENDMINELNQIEIGPMHDIAETFVRLKTQINNEKKKEFNGNNQKIDEFGRFLDDLDRKMVHPINQEIDKCTTITVDKSDDEDGKSSY